MDKLKVLDLFSGIGGFSLGLERTGGFETVAFCEIEPFPRKVLAKHWPNVPCYEDVRTLTAGQLSADGIAVDVICGGFPCQDLSNMGNRAGLAGQRSGLWFEFARLIGELRPKFLLLENVAALLGIGFGDILGFLASIRYDAEWHCIPAGYLGAPHERDRLWIVAYPQKEPGVYEPDIGEAAKRLRDYLNTWSSSPWDEANPRVYRVEDGLPGRVDQQMCLGNAVVPQIPELIGRAILASIEEKNIAA